MTVSARGEPPPSRPAGAPPPRPGEEFGVAAVRLAGFCCLRFGWSPDRFWAATPAEVAAIVAVLLPDTPAPVTRGDMVRLESEHG